MTRPQLEHGAGCECTRCRGFEKGNGVATKHGAYAVLSLRPRAAELAEQLRALVPGYSILDEPAVATLALTLTRLERASEAVEADEVAPALNTDLRGWINTARRLFDDLGLTPSSRARLKLQVGLGEDAALRALERHGRRKNGEPDA